MNFFYDLFLSGKKEVTTTGTILAASLFIVLFDNTAFFQHVLAVYPLSAKYAGFLFSIFISVVAVNVFLLNLVTFTYTTKPILILLLICSSLASYFMDNYDIVIDHIMIQNIRETNWAETSDLLNIKLLLYVLILGIFPSFFVFRANITSTPLKKTVVCKIRNAFISILMLLAMMMLFNKFYTSFFREHKPLRYYSNPAYTIYSLGKYINRTLSVDNKVLSTIGQDARVVEMDDDEDDGRKELVILVVGEAARADHFSLNGYDRKTNPLLEKEEIFNFSNVSSCGTSTAYSVPCMFSIYPRKKFNPEKGAETENILDVLGHTESIDILWRDNNSDSKGVAIRTSYENFRTKEKNTICPDGECRDEGMLIGLDQYIENHKGKDILIVLHQMGNHGPAYYKRYPEAFEHFKPTCKTNQLEECSGEEIINAYDNAILYTDYFLAKVIHFLEQYDETHETAMIYFSDHGESLGENGIYLHGMPYIMAPDSQTHIAALMWFGKGIKEDIDLKKINKKEHYSHDSLFHTLLGIFEVETELYDKDLDILHN